MKLINQIMFIVSTVIVGIGFMGISDSAMATSRVEVPLIAYKTLDICTVVDTGNWRYSGEIALWNESAGDIQDLKVSDWIQSKPFSKNGPFENTYQVVDFAPSITAMTARTIQEFALTIRYSLDAPPLMDSYIRNNARLTIFPNTNQTYKAFSLNPITIYSGELPPPSCSEGVNLGCTYTQNDWTNKTNLIWPEGYSRDHIFYLSEQTCQSILETPAEGNGYYILAAQFLVTILNKSKIDSTAVIPSGIQTTLELAQAWLETYSPGACAATGSCGQQKLWAGILDDYNHGIYPAGPPYCGEE